jgi:vacuolar-type H+-ATPase subunit H
MVRNIDDVKTELRKLTSSKPVHAVAGTGVLAARTLKDLPWRLVQWTRNNPPESLPRRANGYVQTAQSRTNGYVQQARTNANEYVQTARTKAAGGYDKLAEHGKKAIDGQSDSTQRKSATQGKSATQSKGELNGKPRGKAPSSRTGTSN